MDILMAGLAASVQSGELNFGFQAAAFGRLMALGTDQLLMLTGEFEFGLVMVEAHLIPTIGIVTANALSAGHKFLNFIAVRIFVTALARHGSVTEFQGTARSSAEADRRVAIPAGNGQVTAGEFELRFLMIFQRKG